MKAISTTDLAASAVVTYARLYIEAQEAAAAEDDPVKRVDLDRTSIDRFMALREATKAYQAAVEQSLEEGMRLAARWRQLAGGAKG